MDNGSGWVLDIGCATVDKIRNKLRDCGYRYIGLDLRKCQGSVRARADIIPFKSDAFNAAVFSCTIGYVKEWWKSLEEINRVLKSGGLFYMYESVWGIYGKFTAIPKEEEQWIIGFPDGTKSGYVWNTYLEDIVDKCLSIGLDLVRMSVRFDYGDCVVLFMKK